MGDPLSGKAGSAPRVLLVTSQNWSGAPRLPFYFHRAGARVSALVRPDYKLAASSFVSELLPGSSDPDGTLDLLRRHLETGARYDRVFLCDDALLDRAVERSGEGWLAGLFPAKPDAAEALISKCAFSRAMSSCGVPMPAGRRAGGAAEVRAAAEALGFPVIVKPDRGYGGSGVFALNGPESPPERMGSLNGVHLVERRVEGRVGGTAVLFDRGRPAWWSSFLKTGVWPEPFGPSCRRSAFDPGGIEPILEKMGAALGLNGLFGVDWITTPGRELFVIELNGRPIPMIGGGPHTREYFPAALRDFLAGRTARRPPPSDEDGADWHAMPESFHLAVERREWLLAARLLLGLGRRTGVPWHDPGLLKNYVLGAARGALRGFFPRRS